MPSRQTKEDVEVLIIGGGIHGCALAWELAQRGREVVVLEKSVPGAEASSAAAGILGPHLECEQPGPFLDLCRYSLSLYDSWVHRLEEASDIPLGLVRCGGIRVAQDENQALRLQAQAEAMANLDLPGTWCSAPELRRREPLLGEVSGGLVLPEESQVDPRAVMKALPIAAQKAGVQFTRDQVRAIDQTTHLVVEGERGRYTPDQLIVAAGAWSTSLSGTGLARDVVRPARGQIALLRCEKPPARAILFSEHGYVVPRPDGQVLCGSTQEFAGFHKAVTVDGLKRILDMALSLLPCLGSAQFVDAWSGFRPYTDDHLPLLGPGSHPQLWFATGHYRNGILLAPATAQVVADLLCDQEPKVDVSGFAPSRPLPGSPSEAGPLS